MLKDFIAQMAFWGYSLLGDMEPSAEVAEQGWAFFDPSWDSKPCASTGRVTVNGEPAPDWFYLPYVGEHIRRGHEVLPTG